MSEKPASIYERIREILESAKTSVARSVNTTQVVANWLIGREIVEEEQRGKERADYGMELLADLSARLQAEYGAGYSVTKSQSVSVVLHSLIAKLADLAVVEIAATHASKFAATAAVWEICHAREALSGRDQNRNPQMRAGISCRM